MALAAEQTAPASELRCVACSRVLGDVVSQEAGLGPSCRQKYLAGIAGETARAEAERLVRELVELLPGRGTAIAQRAAALRCLGFEGLAGKVERRLVRVKRAGTAAATECGALRLQGFTELADAIEERATSVRIVAEEREGVDGYFVTTRYDEDEIAAFRQIPGRVFVREEERVGNWFPAAAKAALWSVLQQFHSGELAAGPQGSFVIT